MQCVTPAYRSIRPGDPGAIPHPALSSASALFLLALAVLVLGMARPVTVTNVPAGRATVILAIMAM